MTKPEHLNAGHSAVLAGIIARCPAVRAVRRHIAAFAAMMHDLGGERLDAWMRAVEAIWWATGGRAGSYSSREHAWAFEVREDDGWQITAVEAPAWCGGYVRAEACSGR